MTESVSLCEQMNYWRRFWHLPRWHQDQRSSCRQWYLSIEI